MFQSLFFWNGLWDYYVAGGWSDGDTVSILVFLEWPLGRHRFRSSSTLFRQFQSLFFWNGLWDVGGLDLKIPQIQEFQSLFFWNGLWDHRRRCRDGPGLHCFNPCFSGMAFGTARIADAGGLMKFVSILVFLEWPLGRLPFASRWTCIRWFQSLFFWNGLWDVSRPGRPTRAGRVSILVFLEWPLGPTLVDNYYVDVVSFNPCFSGMAFGTTKLPMLGTCLVKFQSLFFWNGLWDDSFRPPLAVEFVSFNPCFSGMAFGTPEFTADAGQIVMFQSLFFWNGLWDRPSHAR